MTADPLTEHWCDACYEYTHGGCAECIRQAVAAERERIAREVEALAEPHAWGDCVKRAEVLAILRGEAVSERIAPLVEAARQHVACICKGLVGEGPRPLGGGRVYHYTGCCADSDIAEALAEWEAHDDR